MNTHTLTRFLKINCLLFAIILLSACAKKPNGTYHGEIPIDKAYGIGSIPCNFILSPGGHAAQEDLINNKTLEGDWEASYPDDLLIQIRSDSDNKKYYFHTKDDYIALYKLVILKKGQFQKGGIPRKNFPQPIKFIKK